MGEIKIERIREQIKVKCARVIMEDLNDPRAGFITVQNVELSKDLRHAKVYVSVLGEEAERRRVMRMLKDATGFIQRAVAGSLRTRVTPALNFVLDTSIDKSFKVAAILDEIKKEKGSPLERSEGLEDSSSDVAAEAKSKDAEDEDEDEDADDDADEDEDWDDVDDDDDDD